VKTARLAIGDAELAYNESGDPDARPLVLIHGLTGHRDDFEPRMEELGALARVLAPDLRGHGDFTKTGRPETFTFAQLVADLGAMLDAWGLDSCDLLGHSFGGMVVLRFALAHPDRVDSLILMSTAPSAPDAYSAEMFEKAGAIARARGMAFLQQLVEKSAKEDPEPSVSDRQSLKWADRYWPHQRRRYAAMEPEAYARLGLLMVQQQPVTARLPEIRCPTTVLVGDADTEFLPGADLLAAGIPGAVRVTLEDAGHQPQMENPADWLAAIREHLARARRRGSG